MIIYLLSLIIYSFFAVTVVYTLFFSLAGKILSGNKLEDSDLEARIAILIPAYKEDEVIISVSEAMLHLEYPKDKYEVYVIADQLKDKTIQCLKKIGIKVIPVSFEISTKAKSLNYCLDALPESSYDLILICDADNVLSKSFLKKVNNGFQNGYKAIQGRRVAKNLDSNYAFLDGISEIINNHIFRKGPNNLGLSSSLIGSGMAFDLVELKSALSKISAVGGFDKVLQVNLIERRNRIIYLEDALVYDEKISGSSDFTNQRKRWLSSQYKYLARFFGKGIRKMLNGNFDYFNIAVLHNIFLPRVLNLGILFVLAGLSLFLEIVYPFSKWDYWILFLVYLFALLIALPRSILDKRFFYAILSIPEAFLNMFLLLFRLKGADKKFIHTKHSKTEIDSSLFSADER